VTALPVPPTPPDAAPGILAELRSRTHDLHVAAERSGILNALLRGTAPRAGYLLLLRNLAPVYRALEDGLARHGGTAALAPLAACRLDRATAIAADLRALGGPHWEHALPLLPEGESYARRVAEAAAGDGFRLVAHAYTRYLGDLSGGQILRRLLGDSLGLQAGELHFYDFSGIAGAAQIKRDYRAMLEQAGQAASDRAALVEEAAAAFSHNIALSEAVQAAL
jgi:heme oxygenase